MKSSAYVLLTKAMLRCAVRGVTHQIQEDFPVSPKYLHVMDLVFSGSLWGRRRVSLYVRFHEKILMLRRTILNCGHFRLVRNDSSLGHYLKNCLVFRHAFRTSMEVQDLSSLLSAKSVR